MAEINYLTIEEAKAIHQATIENSGGGDYGELDTGKLESGIVLEGYRKIQCWENEDNPTIYAEGTDADIPEEYMDREIAYIFPYSPTPSEPGICIELADV